MENFDTFAKLMPTNDAAKALFSQSYEHVIRTDDSQHLKFFEIRQAAAEEGTSDGDDGGWDTASGPLDVAPHEGYFNLSFEKGKEPLAPLNGWTVGQGTETKDYVDVDFMISPPHSSRSKAIGSVHCSLHLHPVSGMVILAAMEQPVVVNFCGMKKKLVYPDQCLIYQQFTQIRLGNLEFALELNAHFDRNMRSYFIGTMLNKDVNIEFPLFPVSWKKVMKNTLCVKSIGSGFHGWIYAGFDTESGEPLAIKRFGIKAKDQVDVISHEVAFGHSFKNVPGLMPVYGAACEHGETHPCGIIPEEYFFTSPLGQFTFKDYPWKKINYRDKLGLLIASLRGIAELHRRGIAHRDVHGANVLVTSAGKVLICDFGKLTKTDWFKTNLGPPHSLAPEVWTLKGYDKQIDIWACGYMFAEILLGKVLFVVRTDKITQERREKIIVDLEEHATSNTEQSPLIELIKSMLEWDPQSRPSADQALEHRCWVDALRS